jgi:hypothetical protein
MVHGWGAGLRLVRTMSRVLSTAALKVAAMIGLRPTGLRSVRHGRSGRSRARVTAMVTRIVDVLVLRRILIVRIVAAAVLALVVTAVSLQVYNNTPAGFPSGDQELRELGLALLTAVLVAVITARVGRRHGSRRALVVAVVLAYIGTRVLSAGLLYPGSLNAWSPYPILGWLEPGWIPLACILAQAWLLRPVYPLVVSLTARARPLVLRVQARVPLLRDGAGMRKLAALLICALVFGGWDWLSGAIGAASAAFFCALAMVMVMLLAGDRRYVLFGAVACAGFLAVSALVQEAPPSDVLVSASRAAPGIGFGIEPPAGAKIDTSGLQLRVILDPLVPTVFHCPTQVYAEVFIDDQDQKVQAQLRNARYALTAPGTTAFTPPTSFRDRPTASTFLDAAGRLNTQIVGGGLQVGDDPADDQFAGDEWVFSAPLQSWRSMGTCYVVIPTFNLNTAPYGYWVEPAKATVQLSPWKGSAIDLTNTAPQPTADPMTQGAFDWTCYDYTNVEVQGNGQCPAVSVVTANWANSYTQVAILLVGTLIAIAAERWFHTLKLDEEPDDNEPSDPAQQPSAELGRSARSGLVGRQRSPT